MLHGTSADSRPFTLIRLTQTSFQIALPGFPKATYHVATALAGGYVGPSGAYSEAYVSFGGLGGWLDASGLQPNVGPGPGFGMTFAQPQALLARPEPGVLIETFFQAFTDGSRHSWSVEEVPTIHISLKNPRPLEDVLLGWALPIADLITLGLRQPSGIRGVSVLPANAPPSTCLELFRTWIGFANSADDHPLVDTMNFSAREYRGGFGPLVARWMKLRREMQNVLSTYFGGLYAPPTYVETRFLILAYAIEGYHRFGSRETRISVKEFASIKRAAVSATPPALVDLVSSRMTAYVRELTLQDRLDMMITRTGPVLGTLFEAAPKFSALFKKARNDNTHLGSKKPRQVEPITFYFLTEIGRYLLDVSLMLDLGFSARCAKQLVHRQRGFVHLVANVPPELK